MTWVYAFLIANEVEFLKGVLRRMLVAGRLV